MVKNDTKWIFNKNPEKKVKRTVTEDSVKKSLIKSHFFKAVNHFFQSHLACFFGPVGIDRRCNFFLLDFE